MRSFDLDRDKFDRLVHYIISSCADPAQLGSTKLQKILWKSDTGTYKLEARPITGATYTKRNYGPATDEFWDSRERLKKSGMIDFWRDERFAGKLAKDVYKSLTKPDVSFLSEKEKMTVDFWIKEICTKHTAKSISDDTHGYAWEIAKLGEELPLYSVFVDDLPDEPDPEGQAWAEAEVRRMRLGQV